MTLSLKALKEKAYEINDIEYAIHKFEEKSPLLDLEFIKKLNNETVNELYFGIKLLHSCFLEKQIITERTQSLIANLGRLRASIVTSDFCRARKIIYKHLYENYTNLKYLIQENTKFEKDLVKLTDSYKRLFVELRQSTKKDFTKEKAKTKFLIIKLKKIHADQKELLKSGSFYFLKYSNEIMRLNKQNKCDLNIEDGE